MEPVYVKRVRPWVKLSFLVATTATSYALARQFGLLKPTERIIKIDLEELGPAKEGKD